MKRRPKSSKGPSLRKTPRVSAEGQIPGEKTKRSLKVSVETTGGHTEVLQYTGGLGDGEDADGSWIGVQERTCEEEARRSTPKGIVLSS